MQQEIADMLGWGRTQVANYAALKRIGPAAWQQIVTAFETTPADDEAGAVTARVTGVTENLT